MTTQTLIKQGAEGKLYIGEYNGLKCVIKERFVKKYRHPDLDAQLTKERIRAESKSIGRCENFGVLAPKIYYTDLNERKIYMEFYEDSMTVKDYINKYLPEHKDSSNEKLEKLGKLIGTVVGKLHANNVIHGDLTTSNMLLIPKSDDKTSYEEYDLAMVDFGLSQYHSNTEAKGVDLYVLERALLSTHSGVPKLFSIILKSYSEENQKNCDATIAKFEEVRARGRKRTMVG